MSKPEKTPTPGIIFADMIQDRNLFRALRRVMLRSERLWLLDCQGDYYIYRTRLRELARTYKISVPEEPGK